MNATPWSLDELEMPDIFTAAPLNDFSRGQPSMSQSAGSANGDAEIHAAQERVRSESAAYARGRAEGEQAAQAAAIAKVSTAVQALEEALESVRVHEARWTLNAEENLAALAIAIARHVLAREVEIDPAVVIDLVQRALTQFPIDQVISVRLHPDDLATCSKMIATPDGLGRTHEVRWIPDTHLVRGGCLVEGRERVIDGRVDTVLERMYRAIGGVQS